MMRCRQSLNKQCLVTLLSGMVVGFIVSSMIFSPVKINSADQLKNSSVADAMYKKVRILCWVMTEPNNHQKRAKHVNATWGKHCNKLLFMSSERDDDLPTIALPILEGRNNSWGKTKEAFKYIYHNHFHEYDWFLKADDDTYVILENLRYMLMTYSPTEPVYYGCRFKPYVKQGYMSGGAGYVLSNEALRRFVEVAIGNKTQCSKANSGAEDVEIGRCLEAVDVKAGDSRDSEGKWRFFPFELEHHFIPKDINKSFWYYENKEGMDCCSNNAVSFHYVYPDQMYVFEYFIYHLRPYGITYNVEMPSELSAVEEEEKNFEKTNNRTTITRLNLPQILKKFSGPLTIFVQDKSKCYSIKNQKTLPDISDLQPPPSNKSIFFHESSCKSHFAGKIVITARQACAVESAARLNPDHQIYLLYTSPGVLKLEENTESDRWLLALLSQYKNVKILHVNFEKYTNTPLENLYNSGALHFSTYPVEHASDLLRYLTLWKYGGIYLDLDVVVMKSLEDLGVNYAGIQSNESVAEGILNFGKNGCGHKIVDYCLNELKEDFRGDLWGYNGPELITNTLRKLCREDSPEKMVKVRCYCDFVVYSWEKFYPIAYWDWSLYFNEIYTPYVMNLTQNSYVIHVWNKYSANEKLPIGNKAVYSVYAQKYCLRVYQEIDKFF